MYTIFLKSAFAGLLGIVLCANAFSDTSESIDLSGDTISLREQLISLSVRFNTAILFQENDLVGLSKPEIDEGLSLKESLDVLVMRTSLVYKLSPSGILILNVEHREESFDSEILVRGFRHSLYSSQLLKESALGIQDSVVAEDIADFPDQNLADALQRIPGVTINREAGEGRQISVRGIGPDFTLVTMNGMPVLSNTDSPMDSRGQKTRDRAFDFNTFAAELFSEVTVKKNYQVSDLEGGIAGTVQLNTPKPFDVDDYRAALVVTFSDNELTNDTAPRITGLVSNTWEKIGALISISASNRLTQEQGGNTFRWRKDRVGTAMVSDLDQQTQRQWRDEEIFHPTGNRYSVWNGKQERIGLTHSLQYQTDKLQASLDLLYSRFKSDREEFHLGSRGANSTPINLATTRVERAETNSANELVFAQYSDARIASESRSQIAQTIFLQNSIKLAFKFSDIQSVDLLVGHSSSEFDMPFSNKVFIESDSDLSIDYRPDPFYGEYRYATNLIDNNVWQFSDIDSEQYYEETEQNILSANYHHEISNDAKFKFGFGWSEFKNATARQIYNDLLAENWGLFRSGITAGQTADDVISISADVPSALSGTFNSHSREDWLAVDVASTLDFFDVNLNELYQTENGSSFSISDSNNLIVEDSLFSFAEFTHRTRFLDKSLDLVSGLRFYKTEIKRELRSDLFDGFNRYDYEGVLSSLLARLNLSDQVKLKMSYSENITRPDLRLLSRGPSLEGDDDIVAIRNANSELEPYKSQNFDVSLDYYADQASYLSVAFFYKHLKDFIVSRSRQTILNNLGGNVILGDDLSESEHVVVINQENEEATKIYGLEWSMQKQMDFLPGGFKDLGILFNATVARGKLNYFDENTGRFLFEKKIPNLSERSYSTTLYYENNTWGGRITSTYRSDYISQVDFNVLDQEDERGFRSTTHVDAQLFYYLNDQLKLSLEAINLTNQREEQYSDSSNRAYNTTLFGTTYSVGATLHF